MEKFHPRFGRNVELSECFKNVRVYESSMEVNPNYLYIVKQTDFCQQVSRFHNMPIILFGSKDCDTDFIGIQIGAEFSLWEIFQTVQDIFLYYETWNHNILNAIVSHKSIETIADLAAEVLDKPYFLFDIAFKKICQAGEIPETFENPDFTSVMEHGYLPFEKKGGSKERIYSYEQCGRTLYPSIGTAENCTNILLNIYVNREFFAIFVSMDTMERCSKGQISLMYHVRDLLEMAFTANMRESGLEETSDYYVKKLLDQEYVEERMIGRMLEPLNWKLKGYFQVYTLCDQHGKLFNRVKQEFCLFRVKENLKNVIAMSYENYILVICKFSCENDETDFDEKLNRMLGEMVICCGKSQRFERFADLRIYYQQAIMTFKYGLASNTGKTIWDFQNEYFSCIANRLSANADLEVWVDPSVLKLHKYDFQNNTEYVKYLKTFLICGGNIKLAAQHLFFHRNTLIYRLEKIRQILGFDVIELQNDRKVQILFSCMILGNN